MVKLGFYSGKTKKVVWLGDNKDKLKDIFSEKTDINTSFVLEGTLNVYSKFIEADAFVNCESSIVYNIRCNDKSLIPIIEIDDSLYFLRGQKWLMGNVGELDKGKVNATEISRKKLLNIVEYKSMKGIVCKKGKCNNRRGSVNCYYCDKVSGCELAILEINNSSYKIYYGDGFCEIEDESNKPEKSF